MIDVSVLMPVYNAGRYPEGWVERAITSVVTQSEIDVEVCIGDDNSTDGFLKRFKDDRIRIAKNPDGPTGGADACNCAASIARGKYFILLSCRSWYQDRALTAMSKYLDTHPEIGFVYGSSVMYLPDGNFQFKHPPAYTPQQWRHAFPWSFGYMYRREAWDAGCKYGVTIETLDGYFTIADHDYIMQLIHVMKYKGYVMQGLTTLHYQYGGTKQQSNYLAKYKAQLTHLFEQRWRGV